jgi:hypothetical protein
MDVISLAAALLGLAGIALGSLGWWKANQARAIAEDAARAAQEAKLAAAAATATRAAEPSATPQPAANSQPALPSPLEVAASAPTVATPPRTENSAHIVVRSGSNPGEDLPTNQGTGSGLIGIFLVNEGPAPAHEMQLHATFPNGTRRSSELHRTLSAHKELTLFAQVVPPDFGADDPLHVVYQIDYQDGDGQQGFERDIRLEGGWKGPWKTYIEAKP